VTITTDHIALYAAILSTVIFVWEIYKYSTRGARLKVRVGKDKLIIPDPVEEGKLWVSISISNVGDQPTTLTGIGSEVFSNWRDKLRKKPDSCFVFPNPKMAEPLPRLLSPGQEWRGFIAQANERADVDLGELCKDKIVIISVSVAHTNKPKCVRLI